MLNPKPNLHTCSPLILLTQTQINVLTDYSKGQPKLVWEETVWPPIKNNKKWSNSLPPEKTQNSLASKFLLPLHRKCNFQTILNLYNILRLPAILPWYPGLLLCNYAEHVLRIQCSVITEIFDLFLEKTSYHHTDYIFLNMYYLSQTAESFFVSKTKSRLRRWLRWYSICCL